ncbi:hypothetical protein MC885_021747, partial [Smutsia gigantea]
CCCRAEDAEAPFEQSICVQQSKARIAKAAPSSRKTHPCEMCGPVLRDIFHFAEDQGTRYSQKLLRCGACAKRFYFSMNFQWHPERHVKEKPFRNTEEGSLSVISCGFPKSGKRFTCGEVEKDFPASLGHLQQQASGFKQCVPELSTEAEKSGCSSFITGLRHCWKAEQNSNAEEMHSPGTVGVQGRDEQDLNRGTHQVNHIEIEPSYKGKIVVKINKMLNIHDTQLSLPPTMHDRGRIDPSFSPYKKGIGTNKGKGEQRMSP